MSLRRWLTLAAAVSACIGTGCATPGKVTPQQRARGLCTGESVQRRLEAGPGGGRHHLSAAFPSSVAGVNAWSSAGYGDPDRYGAGGAGWAPTAAPAAFVAVCHYTGDFGELEGPRPVGVVVPPRSHATHALLVVAADGAVLHAGWSSRPLFATPPPG